MPELRSVAARQERRRERRFLCDLGITVEWGEAALAGRVHDISETGMFVKMEGPLWIGARFLARLAVEMEQTASVECVVNRVDPRRGMAVTYAPTGEPSREALASLLQGLAAQ